MARLWPCAMPIEASPSEAMDSRTGPIYRARGVGRGLAHAVHCPIRSDPTDRVRINVLTFIIKPIPTCFARLPTTNSYPRPLQATIFLDQYREIPYYVSCHKVILNVDLEE